MGCGCKKKKINPASQPRKIIVTEGEVKVNPPEVLKAPQPLTKPNVDNIVNKLYEILTPKN